MSKKPDNTSETQHPVLKETAVAYAPVTRGEGEFYSLQTPEDRGWEEFRDQCRRQMQRPLATRIKYGFARKAVSPDAERPNRAFDTMAQYRAWCETNLPDYLGFKRRSK